MQTPSQVIAQWRGNVLRWHSSPVWQLRESGDTTQAHAKRCASLYLALWPDCTVAELAAVLAHDDGESGVGDIAWKAKRQHPELKAAADLAESARLTELGLELHPNTERLALVDGIDALLWAQSRAPHILTEPDFVSHILAVQVMEYRLGLRPRVTGILREGGVNV